jgi:diaminopimelate epimerase
VARRLGLVDGDVTVRMPGGILAITVGPDYRVDMTGPVTRVGEGTFDPEALAERIPGLDS